MLKMFGLMMCCVVLSLSCSMYPMGYIEDNDPSIDADVVTYDAQQVVADSVATGDSSVIIVKHQDASVIDSMTPADSEEVSIVDASDDDEGECECNHHHHHGHGHHHHGNGHGYGHCDRGNQ
jgi:hypothetical protein